MKKEEFDVIVVGGGASGMMAASRARERGKRVLLLEKNKRLGEKLRITGGGRCNITNAELDERALLGHYGEAEKFLYSSFAQFGVQNTFSFFESKGLPLVVEERKRAFPHTHKASDVCEVFVEHLKELGVVVRTGTPVTKVVQEASRIVSVVSGEEEFFASSFIFAVGGVSHPETGSTGDGFLWLKELGHTVIDPTPNIVPLAVRERWVKQLAGISLSDMKISFFSEGVKVFSKKGRLLFTHFGLSGPLILNSSSKVRDLLYSNEVTAAIDLFPEENLGSLDKRVTEVFDTHKNKVFKNVAKEIVPAGMTPGFLLLTENILDPETKVHSVTKEQRKALVRLLKAMPLTVTGLMGYDKAVVSDGGIVLSEVNTRSMASQKISNLFLTGDLLNINRPSGGYSLQLCWTTGFVAGSHA